MIRVLKGGILSSIQGRYRKGFMHLGVPWSGPMDEVSMLAANYLTGNEPWSPTIEMIIKGPDLLFTEPMSVAVCGADMSPAINGRNVNQNKLLSVGKDDILSFSNAQDGKVAYLAVAGKMIIGDYLESPSANLSAILTGDLKSTLKKDDLIEVKPDISVQDFRLPNFFRYTRQSNPVIRVLPGPENHYLTADQQNLFTERHYTISSQSNRMGIRLIPDLAIPTAKSGIVSSAILPGTIQLPESGQPIVMMKDHQTTGGYPRIAQVITHDLDYLSQTTAGQKISFRWTTKAKSVELIRKKDQTVKKLFDKRNISLI